MKRECSIRGMAAVLAVSLTTGGALPFMAPDSSCGRYCGRAGSDT